MWSRLKRLFRSIFGGIIEGAEDPELILKQVIRDMNDKVPQMRENVVQVMGTEKKLRKEVKSRAEIVRATTRSGGAQTGKDEVAGCISPMQKHRSRSNARSSAETWGSRCQARKLRITT